MNWRSLEWVGKKVIPAAVCGLLAVVAAQSIPACSTSNPATTSTGTTMTGTNASTGTNTTDACGHPSPGCGCSQAGETAPCGTVEVHSPDGFFQCSMGTTTCDGTTWGACDGTIKTQGHTITGGGVAIRGYGGPIPCGTQNACDPFCSGVTDTSGAMDAGADGHLASSPDGGLTIASLGSPPNVCNEPTSVPNTLSADLGALSSGFRNGKSSPISCTGTGLSTDNCPFDYACGSGSVCAPYLQGKTNAGCGSSADFTVGLGCWDNGTNPNGLELQVCNRGQVGATSGTLYIDLSQSAPSGTTSACTGTFPNELAAGTGGYCTFPLGTTSISAGECLSFNVFSPTSASGIQCFASSGAALTTTNFPITTSTQIAVVVNPTAVNGFTPTSTASTPLTECDPCNNYTAISGSTLGNASAACIPSLCGTNGGSSASTCTTTLTGIVYDPGINVPLNNIEVYIPTGNPNSPEPFTDPPGGTIAPACDSCSSLNSPFTIGVATDVHGKFTISYPSTSSATTLPYLVIQTGRWRRVLSTVPVNACGTKDLNMTSGAPNYYATSLPQCRNYTTGTPPVSCQTFGDIPKMAVVTAVRESTECWMKKIGIDQSEINAYVPGTGGTAGDIGRVSLYDNNGAGTVSNGVQTGVTVPNYTSSGATTYTLLNVTNPAYSTLNNYSVVLMPCAGSKMSTSSFGSTLPSTGMNGVQTQLTTYANNSNATLGGGRLFLNHWSGSDWIQNGPSAWQTINSWTSPGSPSASQTEAILNSDSVQSAFYSWASLWDNASGTGYITVSTPEAVLPYPNTSNWENLVVGSTSNWNGGHTNADYSLSSWFNTPTTASAGSYCGRVVYNDMHVNPSRSAYSTSSGGGNAGTGNGTFPGTTSTGCSTGALTADELTLEYQFFQVSACNLGTSLPVTVPSPPSALTATTFTRVYEAKCGAGYTPKWGFFEWKGSIPGNGAGLQFQFSTAPDGTSGAGTYGSLVPATAITQTGTSPSAWTIASPALDGGGALSVDSMLSAAGQSSLDYLQVQITLVPTSDGAQAPDLYTWEQLYDCVP